ncbi:MAG: 1-(5-phosphoribosyl)-5-[Synergistaceae bacterium]|nr:1-(5-phosphoribosyl)-5-[(5-phosphoribosylamino)methylideneamino]imidazole-4-carboxamide isomerase [Synergistaceae bacterium]
MLIFPAIDLYQGQAVRLFQGDYKQMTVYDKEPLNTAKKFASFGAEWLHIVDLEGAKTGTTANLDTIIKIIKSCDLQCEVGGGVRNVQTIEKYINAGVSRVILGTAAVTEENFARDAVKNFAEKIAVGVDIKDGFVAIKGWQEKSELEAINFCEKMQSIGVKTIICTDISKDGAMKGTNFDLYKTLKDKLQINIIASGGVSTIEDVKELAKLNLYGAIVGKAYYTGAINIKEAIEAAKS